MAKMIEIDFEWWKDAKGYRLVDAEPNKPGVLSLSTIGSPQRVVPSGQPVPYQPLKQYTDLFKDFKEVRTAEDVLRFVTRFGPLTKSGLDPELGERVPFVIENAETFRRWFNVNRARPREIVKRIGEEGMVFSRLDVELRADARGSLHLHIRPKTLLEALQFQLAQVLSGGVKLSACLHCGKLFEAGNGVRRLDSKFCSESHQKLYNSLKRSKKT